MKAYMGKQIKYYRKIHNISQAEMADKLGVSRQTIGSWESNRTEPDEEMIKKIADILNTDYIEFYSEIKPMFKDSLSYFEEQLLKAYHDSDELTKKMVNKLLNLEEYTWQE